MLRTRVFRLFLGITVGLVVTAAATEVPFGDRILLEDDYLTPTSVTTGDFDGDGLVDIVAAGFYDTTIAWWRSLGGGSFTRYDIASSVTDIYDVEVADINGDGYPDVVVTSAGTTDAVGWFENDGTPLVGSWALRLIAYPFDGAAGTAMGDLDGDGTLDVAAVAGGAGVVSVAFNINGTGIGWSYETVDSSFAGASWVSVGDLDRDGDLDIAAAAKTSGEVSWWSRDPGGVTWTEHPITVVDSAAVMELVDMDRDGDLDALGVGNGRTIRWWENDGTGAGWTEHTIGNPDADVQAAYPADLDLDGDQDIIYSTAGTDGVGWFENIEGDGLTWEIHIFDTGFNAVVDIAAADFNGDGDLDLVAVSSPNNEVACWDNVSIHRSASFPGSGQLTDATDHVSDLVAADVDGDGDLDLLTAEWGSEQVGWLENVAGDGSSWLLNSIGTSFVANAVAAGDLDGDGLIDVVGASDATLLWWSADGSGGWTENSIPASQFTKNALEVADLDGDGDLDIILGSYSDGVDWFENSGAGATWTERYISGGHPYDADSIVVADIDGDGDPDVGVANSDSVKWSPNDLSGSGFFGAGIEVAASLTNSRAIAAGDIDGDGDLDFASLDQGTDSVMWWSNTSGDGSTWGAATIVATGVLDPRVVRLADFDLDGDLDMALAAEDRTTSDSVVAWYENRLGDGTVWTSHEVAAGIIRPRTLVAADLDGDGDPDLAHDYLGTAADLWWKNRGGQAALPTVATAPLTLDPMTVDDVLEITAIHRGRTGDGDGEVASIDLLLGDGSCAPLSDAEADALLYGIYIFEDDDDSGDFDPALDSEVGFVGTFSLVAGVQTIDLVDGDGKVQISPTQSRTLFVGIVFEDDAADQTPGQIEIIHLPNSSSVEDRDHDLPLRLEWSSACSSGVVVPTNPGLIFADGFESASTDQWSGAMP